METLVHLSCDGYKFKLSLDRIFWILTGETLDEVMYTVENGRVHFSLSDKIKAKIDDIPLQ